MDISSLVRTSLEVGSEPEQPILLSMPDLAAVSEQPFLISIPELGYSDTASITSFNLALFGTPARSQGGSVGTSPCVSSRSPTDNEGRAPTPPRDVPQSPRPQESSSGNSTPATSSSASPSRGKPRGMLALSGKPRGMFPEKTRRYRNRTEGPLPDLKLLLRELGLTVNTASDVHRSACLAIQSLHNRVAREQGLTRPYPQARHYDTYAAIRAKYENP